MKLHSSVVEKLIYVFKTYGGYASEAKLKSRLDDMDLTVYERKTTSNQEMILVLTEDYVKSLNKNK